MLFKFEHMCERIFTTVLGYSFFRGEKTRTSRRYKTVRIQCFIREKINGKYSVQAKRELSMEGSSTYIVPINKAMIHRTNAMLHKTESKL